MRLFYGIQLPEEVKEELSEFIILLQSYIPTGVKWVEKENLHITFQFIGDVKPTQLAELEDDFITSISSCNSQKFMINSAEIFPLKQPRLIWVSLDSANNQLHKATKSLRNLLKNKGFILENKDFIPHITLGRIKSNLIKPQIEFILGAELKKEEFNINEISLFESNLTKRGANYRILKTYNLL